MTVNLKQERLNRGLTLRDAGEEIGVSTAAVQRAEAGRLVSPANAKAIADFYEFKPSDIWPVSDSPAQEASAA